MAIFQTLTYSSTAHIHATNLFNPPQTQNLIISSDPQSRNGSLNYQLGVGGQFFLFWKRRWRAWWKMKQWKRLAGRCWRHRISIRDLGLSQLLVWEQYVNETNATSSNPLCFICVGILFASNSFSILPYPHDVLSSYSSSLPAPFSPPPSSLDATFSLS